MQKAIELTCNGFVLRGMAHIPERASDEKLPAVILFHGFTGNKLEPHRMFVKISRALEKLGFAVFRYDFSGSGESDGDFEQMTVSGEIAEAHAILDAVQNDPRVDATQISLIGLSMGGLVASVLAGDRPQDVHKLVLMAAAGNMYDIIKDTVDAYLAYPDLQVVDHDGNLVGRAFAEDLKTLDVFTRAKSYDGDVLLIHGTKDDTVPYDVSLKYQELSYGGRAKLHSIEDADHTFNRYEWETEVIDSICQFIGEK